MPASILETADSPRANEAKEAVLPVPTVKPSRLMLGHRREMRPRCGVRPSRPPSLAVLARLTKPDGSAAGERDSSGGGPAVCTGVELVHDRREVTSPVPAERLLRMRWAVKHTRSRISSKPCYETAAEATTPAAR